MIMPFDRTPTNIVARLLEYTPGGAVYGAARTAYRAAAAKIANKAFTPNEQRQFAQTFGRGVTGSALIVLGYALAASGQATGVYDEKDKAGNRANKEMGRSPMAVKVGDRWFQIGAFSPLGNLIALGATLHDKPDTSAALVAKEVMGDQPLLRGTKDLLSVTESGDRMADKAGYMAGSFIPSAVADVAEATDSKSRKSFGFQGQIRKRLPGVRNLLPEDENVQHSRLWAVDPFRTTTEGASGVSRAEAKAKQHVREQMPQKEFTPEDKERSALKKSIIEAIKDNKIDDARKLAREAVKSGAISNDEAVALGEKAKLPVLVYDVKHHYNLKDALELYYDKDTTDEERRALGPVIGDKMMKLDPDKIRKTDLEDMKPKAKQFYRENRNLFEQDNQ
jgi:hypothetical protein